jgi:pimeloyl-ACP methyl ester carboxylesterase
VIERGSHALQLEFPQEFNAAVLDFIAAHAGTASA